MRRNRSRGRSSRSARRPSPYRRAYFEPLDDRILLAVLVPNSDADDVTPGDGQFTLREALNNANSDTDTTGGDGPAGDGDDVINLELLDEITLTMGPLPITSSVEIIKPVFLGALPKTTIDAANASRIFEIDDGGTGTIRVTLVNLTLIGGNAGDMGTGGAIFNFSSQRLAIVNSDLRDNTAGNNGGAIFSTSPFSMTLRNTVITDNTAGNSGGGMYLVDGTTTVDGGEIRNNTALSGNGAGVYIDSGGSANFSGTRFDGNSADFGGAIFNAGTLDVKVADTPDGDDSSRPRLVNNQAARLGGGLFNASTGNATFSGVDFDSNLADSGAAIYNEGFLTLIENNLSNNTADQMGGGILAVDGFLTITKYSSPQVGEQSRISKNRLFLRGFGVSQLFPHLWGAVLRARSTATRPPTAPAWPSPRADSSTSTAARSPITLPRIVEAASTSPPCPVSRGSMTPPSRTTRRPPPTAAACTSVHKTHSYNFSPARCRTTRPAATAADSTSTARRAARRPSRTAPSRATWRAQAAAGFGRTPSPAAGSCRTAPCRATPRRATVGEF
jgi:hypothetical protein